MTAQAKINLTSIQLIAWVANNFTTTDILFYQLYYIFISPTGLKIILLLCLLLSFLHTRITCKHKEWAADILTSLDMLF